MMLCQNKIIFFLLMTVAMFSGCTRAISEQVRAQVNEGISLKAVRENPSGYTDEMTLWAGEIITAKNEKEGTMIEILQKPADLESRPKQGDLTEGRFLAYYKGYLDVAIYAKGREVTVAGRLKGERVQRLGEIEYTYPVIEVEEIYLWPEREKEQYPFEYYYPWPRPHWYYW